MPRSSTSKRRVVAGERDRPDAGRRRAQWTKYQYLFDPDRWSSSTSPGPGPTWRRCGAGRHAGAGSPPRLSHGRWKTMSFMAALRCDRIEVPWVIEGPIDGAGFQL